MREKMCVCGISRDCKAVLNMAPRQQTPPAVYEKRKKVFSIVCCTPLIQPGKTELQWSYCAKIFTSYKRSVVFGILFGKKKMS